MRRRFIILLATLALPVAGATALAWQQPTPAPPLTGTWRGTVSADIGQMTIALTVKANGTTASGEIENAHGKWAIKQGKLADGVWTLPFQSEDGAKGEMKGTIKGDTFSGAWNFSPVAVGTFELTRQKDPAARR